MEMQGGGEGEGRERGPVHNQAVNVPQALSTGGTGQSDSVRGENSLSKNDLSKVAFGDS